MTFVKFTCSRNQKNRKHQVSNHYTPVVMIHCLLESKTMEFIVNHKSSLIDRVRLILISEIKTVNV